MRHRTARPLAVTLAVLCGLCASGCAPVATPVGSHDASASAPSAAGHKAPKPTKAPKAPKGTKTPAAPKAPQTPATSTGGKIVLTEPRGHEQVHRNGRLSGRFGFVGDTCLGLVVEDGGTFLVRMPEGTRVAKVADEWRVFTSGAPAGGIVVGEPVKGSGGDFYRAGAEELSDVPTECRGVGLAQFRIEK